MDNALRAAVGIGAKTLRANQTSWLKRLPLQAKELPNDQKIKVAAGFELPVENVKIVDGHYQFDSHDVRFAGIGFAFVEHFDPFEIVKEGKPNLVTREQAEYIFENTISDSILEDLNSCLYRFGITEKEDIRQFLAQCGHESAGLRYSKEIGSAEYFTENYEWRSDLGNNQAGDGARFSGGGYIQLTGRANHQALADFLGDPRVMEGVDYVGEYLPFTSAAFWWYNNDMSAYVASGATCRQVSARVNGKDPANGLDDRLYYYKRARDIIDG
jgi:predicted chitinase